MSLPTGYQELLNAHTNKCADVADKSTEVGHVVHQWSCHRDDNQLWKVEGNVNGFMLRNLRSQLCLTTNWPFTNGTEITQTQCGWESGAVAWQPQNDGDFIKWFNKTFFGRDWHWPVTEPPEGLEDHPEGVPPAVPVAAGPGEAHR